MIPGVSKPLHQCSKPRIKPNKKSIPTCGVSPYPNINPNGGFLSHGGTPNHPLFAVFVHHKQTILDTPWPWTPPNFMKYKACLKKSESSYPWPSMGSPWCPGGRSNARGCGPCWTSGLTMGFIHRFAHWLDFFWGEKHAMGFVWFFGHRRFCSFFF